MSSRVTSVVLMGGLALSRLTQGSILMVYVLGLTSLDFPWRLQSCREMVHPGVQKYTRVYSCRLDTCATVGLTGVGK